MELVYLCVLHVSVYGDHDRATFTKTFEVRPNTMHLFSQCEIYVLQELLQHIKKLLYQTA